MIDSYQASYTLKPKELEAVYAISKIVSVEVNLDKALERIIHIAREVLIFDSAVVYVRQGEDEPEAVFARSIGRGRSAGSILPWGEVAALETLKTGKIFIQESGITPEQDRLAQQFYLSLPMLIGGNVTGALVFIRFGGPSYDTDHISIAEFITTHISQLFEQKRLVTQIADLQAKQKLAELQDEFVAMVSHELKTPLGFIKGYTTTLLRQDTSWDPETQREFLLIIDDEADKLSEQIENLLNSFRLKSQSANLTTEPIPLSDFFKGLLDKLARQGVNLEINLEVSPSDLIVFADQKMLAQVSNNIISNASKYAPNATLRIQAERSENEIQLSFQDDGPGIPEQHLEDIFKQFFRVPDRSGGVRGAGLGLFICKQIIEAHHGKIWVESDGRNGTTFFVRLPNNPTIDF
jgi:K+-sensing histidine kinase KdpD